VAGTRSQPFVTTSHLYISPHHKPHHVIVLHRRHRHTPTRTPPPKRMAEGWCAQKHIGLGIALVGRPAQIL